MYDVEERVEYKIQKNFDGPPIPTDEVRSAIKHMKHGKAPGTDNINIEMIAAMEFVGVETITKRLNEIYDTAQIPTDLFQSIFTVIPKKPAAIECELHRTISLMSHVIKILLRIIRKKARSTRKPETANEQCGCVEGKRTIQAIYIPRTLIVCALKVK